jgi:hypothetical protein
MPPEFRVDGAGVRSVNGDVVQALDAALASMLPGAQVLHAFDPQRIVKFAGGGPPVWSVGVASHPSGVHQFLTYGLSSAVEPGLPFGFELTMRVRSPGPPPLWPTLLLRSLARYQLGGREMKPGHHADLGGPISQAPVRPEERASMPATRMTTVLVMPGWTLPTPGGPVEIRSVVGLDPRERQLLEACPAEAFCDELRRYDPSLTVALDSPSVADHPTFRASVEAIAARARPPEVGQPGAAAAATPGAGTKLYIHFACSCGAKYATPADKMPKTTFRIACKSCKTVIVVPEEGRLVNDKAYPLVGMPPRA